MPKSRPSLSLRRTSRSRTKRAVTRRKTIANKQINSANISGGNTLINSPPPVELEKEANAVHEDPQSSSNIEENTQRNSPPLVELETLWNGEQNVAINCDHQQPSSSTTSFFEEGNNQVETTEDAITDAWGTEEDYQTILAEKLHIEVTAPETKIEGNRIVEIGHLLERTIRISENHARSCTSGNLFIEKEIRSGLASTIVYKCNLCDKMFSCTTENPTSSTINTAVVWGTLSTGSTYKHTEEFLSTMNIPPISNAMFYTIQDDLSKVWEESFWENIQMAGQEERRLAVANGQIDSAGIPWICVYLDGGWSKRSYGHNYNAASGVAVIIGKATKKVLYMGVRNKFCIICARAKNKNITAQPHKCFKNWSGSSAAMEPDIIVEGFLISEELHGLRYKEIIADGDSSVFLKIQEKVPYGKEVNKIECTNHVMKNYGKRLYGFQKDTKNVSLAARKLLPVSKIKELQKIAQKAIYDNAHGDIATLIEDLKIGPYHAFGQHSSCKDYFCSNVGDDTNSQIRVVQSSGLLRLIQGALSLVIQKANYLIDNETNNRAELFMSILARFNMGKRLNLIQRGSFKIRSELTAMRYNERFKWHTDPWKRAAKRSPGKYMKRYMHAQTKYKRKLVYNEEKPKRIPRQSEKMRVSRPKELDYGPLALQPELSEKNMQDECNQFLETLEVTTKERQLEIAMETVGQFDNPIYRTERAKRLTASNFGSVTKRRDYTPCHCLVKTILSTMDFTSEATEYGKMNESVAISLLEDTLGVKVKQTGLFIDLKHPFLGASPDGLVGDNKLVEVKCLPKVSKLQLTLEEAARKLNICLEFKDNKLNLKRNHNYYFQVQGQLHITGRSLCYFVVFVNSNSIFIEEITKDDNFWSSHIEPKLVRFYKECILPEIIRGNLKRGLKCVDPKYILDAQKQQQQQVKKKKKTL